MCHPSAIPLARALEFNSSTLPHPHTSLFFNLLSQVCACVHSSFPFCKPLFLHNSSRLISSRLFSFPLFFPSLLFHHLCFPSVFSVSFHSVWESCLILHYLVLSMSNRLHPPLLSHFPQPPPISSPLLSFPLFFFSKTTFSSSSCLVSRFEYVTLSL